MQNIVVGPVLVAQDDLFLADIGTVLVGVEAAGGVGSLVLGAASDATIGLLGVAAAGAVGDLTIDSTSQQDITETLPGVAAVGTVGRVKITGPRPRGGKNVAFDTQTGANLVTRHGQDLLKGNRPIGGSRGEQDA